MCLLPLADAPYSTLRVLLMRQDSDPESGHARIYIRSRGQLDGIPNPNVLPLNSPANIDDVC